VAILLAKQRHGLVFVDGHVNRNLLDDLDPLVPQDFFINHVLDVLQLFVFDCGEMRKIKAQMVRRHQRPRLLHMLAQHLAQPGLSSCTTSSPRVMNSTLHPSSLVRSYPTKTDCGWRSLAYPRGASNPWTEWPSRKTRKAALALCFAAPFQEARARSRCSAIARSKPA